VKRSVAHHAVAQAFIVVTAFVGRLGRRSEPALVNAAAVQAVGVGVVRVQLDAQAGLQKRARHPGWRQAEQAAGRREFGFDDAFDVGFDLLEVEHGGFGHGEKQWGGRTQTGRFGYARGRGKRAKRLTAP
jgi:hypothetical protein